MFKPLLFLKKTGDFRQKENLKVRQKKLLSNDDVITVITRLLLKLLLKTIDVFYQVSSDLGEVNSFYSNFSDVG